MKSSTVKIIAFLLTVLMLLLMIQMPIQANTEEKNIILKKANDEFIIYYENICNNEFQFAFSKDKTTGEGDLSFTNSVKDQLTEKSLNVAYIDTTSYNQVVENSTTYIWIKDMNDNLVISGEELDLKNSIDDSIIEVVNNTTKRIEVDTTQKNQTNEMVNEVDTTITTGKVVIKEQEGARYSYQLIKLADNTTEANQLFDLAEKLKENITDTYTNLSLTKQFYDLYMELMPVEWTDVENGEILQPEDTVEGDKYILYIREDIPETDKTTIDAKFLVCEYEQDAGFDKKEETITETVKLPVTYDSIVLIVVFAIIILAIIIVAILKVKSNKKDKQN